MRTTGPNEASLRLTSADAGLRAGAIVSVVVRERIGADFKGIGGLYRVAIGPRLLTASSATGLEPGTVLKARVERSGDAILLRIAARDLRESAGPALSAAGLPNDVAARAAVAALLREGMAPEARALARVRRAALREAAEGGEWTDLAAKMEAKGIPAEGAALEGLVFLSKGGYESADGGGEGDREERQGTELVETLELPESELPSVLGALLRGLVIRTGGSGPLTLFNHLRGPQGSWVFVPFRFALDAVDFSGSFRIQLPYVLGGYGLFEASFSASRGTASEDWSFFLSFGGGKTSTLRIERPEGGNGGLGGSLFDKFAAELAALSCSVRVSSRGAAEGAGDEGLDLNA
jgi:hypothetical protein